MLVLTPGDEVEMITPDSLRLLEPLRAAEGAPRRVPVPIIALAAEARRAGRTGRPTEPLNVPTASGWLTFHASLPDGSTSGRVAIVVQQATDLHVAPPRLEAFGLTPREREVAGLVASGTDTAGIAERLFLSPCTVQDHLKAIFEKTGTRSRRELRVRIFFSDYLPAIASARPLAAEGTPVGLRDG